MLIKGLFFIEKLFVIEGKKTFPGNPGTWGKSGDPPGRQGTKKATIFFIYIFHTGLSVAQKGVTG